LIKKPSLSSEDENKQTLEREQTELRLTGHSTISTSLTFTGAAFGISRLTHRLLRVIVADATYIIENQ
jgi:hypothetical protein